MTKIQELEKVANMSTKIGNKDHPFEIGIYCSHKKPEDKDKESNFNLFLVDYKKDSVIEIPNAAIAHIQYEFIRFFEGMYFELKRKENNETTK